MKAKCGTKVIINKTGRSFIDTTAILRAIESKHLLTYYEIEETKKHDRRLEYYCTNCGCHLQGIWAHHYLRSIPAGRCFSAEGRAKKDRDYNQIAELLKPFYNEKNELEKNVYGPEQDQLSRLTNCPVCGAELKRKEGYFFSDIYSFTKDDKVPDELKHARDYDKYYHPDVLEAENAQLVRMAKQFASSCDIPAAATLSANDINNICSNPANLKEYLKNLIELEMGIYSLTERLKALYVQRASSNRNLIRSKYLPAFEKRIELEAAETELQQWEKSAEKYKQGEIGISFPLKPTPPVLATPNLFNKKKVLAENEALQAKYQSELDIYETQVKQYETTKNHLIINAENEAAKTKATIDKAKHDLAKIAQSEDRSLPALTAKTIVDKEIDEAQALLKKLYECRNTLYAYNIVFEKYRNVVALSTFYEYLMAERCTTLVGADGAYNLYENQMRADMIIGQLSQVIEKLDQIKDTQYMIYSSLQTVNRNLDHLNKTMDSALVSIQNMEKDVVNISANTNVIAHNSAVTAYYSKLNADLTNALGYMVAFK